MENFDSNIQKLIHSQIRQVKRRNIGVEQIEVSLGRDKKGKYLTKLTVFMRGKALNFEGSNYNLQKSIKKSFRHLKSILEKKKYRRYPRINLNFGEAA